MKVSRGKVHKYLGMTLDYSVKGQVKITMPKYIDEMLEVFEKIMPKREQHKTKCSTTRFVHSK